MNAALIASGRPAGALPDLSRVPLPLPGDDPAGPSLRYEPVYDQIREARREDDPNLPQGVWVSAGKRADWDLVQQLCLDVLERRSKDVQVAAWLVEALVHRCGFAGMAPGLTVITDLCEAFWDTLHPEIDDGDLTGRLAPIEWLNAALPRVLNTVPITRSGHSPVVAFSYADILNARRLSVVAARDARAAQAARDRGEPLQPDVEGSLAATPVVLHAALHADLDHAIAALDRLVRFLDDRADGAAPSMGAVRETLAVIQAMIATALRNGGHDPDAEPDAGTVDLGPDGQAPAWADDGDGAGDDGAGGGRHGPIRSREEAYFWLSAAADYLMQTEPQNPGPYLVRRAIEWADMPLHEVLLDLSRGRNDLANVFDVLGLSFADQVHRRGVG